MRSPFRLDGAPAEREPDWTVRLGPPVEVNGPPSGRQIGRMSLGDWNYWSAAEDENGTARRWITHHGETARTEFDLPERTITMRPDPRADAAILPLLFAGSGLAHALAADGHGSMHASAVEVDGRAIAFIGHPGKGKSTLAALLCSAGARSISDDLLRCEIEGDRAICHRGGSRIRLRPQAAALAEELAEAEPTADERTSAHAEPTPHERIELAALVVPDPSRERRRIEVTRLRGRHAAQELLRAPRLLGWIDPDLATRHLDLCRELAERVPVLVASCPWGPPFPDGMAAELIRTLLEER